MNFLLSGVQDVRRRIRAQKSRLALASERKELRLAEVALGREGWEIYRFEPEIQSSVARIQDSLAKREELLAKQSTLEARRNSISAKLAVERESSQGILLELGALRTPKVEELKDLQAQISGKERDRALIGKELRTLAAEEARVDRSLADLESALPPPDNLSSRKMELGERRQSIPEERATLVARQEGFDSETKPLTERRDILRSEIADLDDRIRKEKGRFDAEERVAKAQLRDLEAEILATRKSIVEVESSQDEPFEMVGIWLANRETDDSFATQKANVRKHQEKVAELESQLAELRQQGALADPQELRKFYFVAVSLITLIGLSVVLIFGSPKTREWLPSETDVIVSVNASQFAASSFSKKWQGVNPKAWGLMWSAMLEPASGVPEVNLQTDVERITRAIANQEETYESYTLVEMRNPVLRSLENLSLTEGATVTSMMGINVVSRPDGQALAPVGPRTLAVGTLDEVEDLVKVRLGTKPDLKLDEHFFGKFRRLQEKSTFSLISRDPMKLREVTGPLLPTRLLESARLVGLALTVDEKVTARLLIRTEDSQTASEVFRLLRESPSELLRLGDDTVNLFESTPSVSRSGHEIDARFTLPDAAAISFFERLVRLDLPLETAQRKMGHQN